MSLPRTPPLRLGEYSVRVEAPGFKSFNQRGVVLYLGDVRQVDAALEVGQVTDSITVEAEAPLIQTEDATVGTLGPDVSQPGCSAQYSMTCQDVNLSPSRACNWPIRASGKID